MLTAAAVVDANFPLTGTSGLNRAGAPDGTTRPSYYLV
jgi:hypothetical protein